MAYVDKINVQGTDYDINDKRLPASAGIFESITDKNGNKRFIEFNGTATEDTDVLPIYQKGSLSGSHLMLVYAFKVKAGQTLANYALLNGFALPDWLRAKIYPVGASEDWVSVQSFDEIRPDGLPTGNVRQFLLQKHGSSNQLRIFHISTSFTPVNDTYFRVQFDLVIDND